MTRQEALKKGYLKNTTVKIKPLPKGGNKAVKEDPRNVSLFQFTGAVAKFELKQDNRGVLTDIFENDEEREFFEQQTKMNLNVYDASSDWRIPRKAKLLTVNIQKDEHLMKNGYTFDLSDPWDNLRFRIVKSNNRIVAPSWDKRFEYPSYRYAIIEEGYDETVQMEQVNQFKDIWTYFGEIQNSAKKMRDFIEVYNFTKRKSYSVPGDSDKKYLVSLIEKAIEEDKDTFYNLIPKNNEDFDIQVMVVKGVRCGAIMKEGVNKYKIPGEGVSYTYKDLVKRLRDLKEHQDDEFFKIENQIKLHKE